MAIILIGDFQVRLANIMKDDTPVVFAHIIKDPATFRGDVINAYIYVYGCGSLVYWLPALLFKYFNLSPEIPSWLFIYLQNVLLGMALFYYSSILTQRRHVALITVLFAFLAQPWIWNLANYESAISSTYPGQLVLPFLIFTAAELQRDRFIKAAIFLLISGLIHPPLTLQMLSIVLVFYLLRYKNRLHLKRLLGRIIFLIIVAMLCLLPVFFISLNTPLQLSTSEMMEGISKNFHFNPLMFHKFWNYRIPTFLGFLCLLGLALWQHQKELSKLFLSFLFVVLGMTVMLSVLHIAGLVLRLPYLLQLVPFRSTLLLVIFSLPLVVMYLLEKLNADSIIIRFAAASLLFLHAWFSFGLFWGPLLALLLTDFSANKPGTNKVGLIDKRFKGFTMIGQLVFIAWLVIILISGAYFLLGNPQLSSRPIFSILIPGVLINAKGFLFSIVMAFMVSLFSLSLSIKITLIILISLLVFKAYALGKQTNRPLARANYQAQLWARENTIQGKMFIVLIPDLPWRSVSLRPALYPFQETFYVYSGSKSLKRFYDEIQAFADKIGGKDLYNVDKDFLLGLAQRFGGDYIVTLVEQIYKLPVVYKNDYIVIYKVSKIK